MTWPFADRLAVAAAVLCASASPLAQSADATPPPATDARHTSASGEVTVVPFLRLVNRVESWSFLEPPPPASGSYRLLTNRATLGVRATSRRVDVRGSFQYAQVFGLPRHAQGPGSLGPGSLYYQASGTPASYQLYFKALSVRVKNILPGLSAEAGRMGVRSGLEAVSGSPAAAAIARDRLDGLLIGEVEWSAFERAFDGVRVDLDRGRWRADAGVWWPTQGGFEESANPTIDKIRVASVSVTGSPTGSRPEHQWQAFAVHYRDTREVTARPDNTGRPAAAVDVGFVTAGASYLGVYPAGRGRIDTLLWTSVQHGTWYGDEHRAWSVIAEGGYRWATGWRPWLRAGIRYASGDDEPADRRHGTFVPPLPTARPDLLAGVFPFMNLGEAFARLDVTPRERLAVRASVHQLALATGQDLWYSGTGATARRGHYFGYEGRLPSGAGGLGTLVQVSAETRVAGWWTLTGSLGAMRGGSVVRGLFAGDRLAVFAIESALSF